MNKIEEAYNMSATSAKEDINFPLTFIGLTREQETFIIEMFDIERETTKREILETLEEMRGLVDEL